MLAALIALLLAGAQAAPPATTPATKPDVEQENAPRLLTAFQLLRDHQPQAALEVADTAVAAYDAARAGEKRRLYCGMSGPETILYLAMAARDKVDAVAVAPGYCEALYARGFALVDLGRVAEARAVYDRLAVLAPMHAQYITELGQLSRLSKDWPTMLATCERASGAAALADAAVKIAQQTAALRCQGYALVELHRPDDAEARYRDALKLNPADQRAQGELTYIAAQRAKASPPPAAPAPRTPSPPSPPPR